ncbi:hydroxymethylglutaryl-CoA lyase [Saccharata proteae CBS 121410]|uniref:hydroxymethylglutaryl-CoA lyase n=1 Tax=Saccharata proteae CBS 121410 TaxID=1314787 RepID=A0A9P4LWS0_9PEZI|nr:hydroxymethylglutaryl-CoA lyase [Saccharata proteae CBS 121410]
MSFIVPRSSLRLTRTCPRQLSRRSFATSAPRLAEQVRIVEVGPRDGLQNEKKSIPLDTKMELVQKLARTGVPIIEAGSFVSPKWVPQMANSSEILQHILTTPPKTAKPITYQFLLPNARGLDNFLNVYDAHASLEAAPGSTAGTTDNGPALNTSSEDPNAMPSASSGAEAMSQSLSALPKIEISIFTSATETFSQKNTNRSIAESLDRFRPLIARARDQNLGVRAYISVALGCPYEGPDTDPHQVAELAVSLLEMGADIISVADTTGMGTAPKTRDLLKTLAAAGVEKSDLALHFHDTYGQALVNSLVGLEHGVREFDSAVAGLGGCPYSPGATGNVSTEDLVHLFESLGLDTGVDLEKIAEVGDWVSGQVGRSNESRAGKATVARMNAGR